MIKKITTVAIALSTMFMTVTPAYAAKAVYRPLPTKAVQPIEKRETKQEGIEPKRTKKTERSHALAVRASIESTFKEAMKSIKDQFIADITAAKASSRKEKTAAIKAAHIKQQSATRAAKEARKASFRTLTNNP